MTEILRFACLCGHADRLRMTGGKNWWRWRVSNPRPAAYESAALPTELHRHGEKESFTLYHKAYSLDNMTAFTPRSVTCHTSCFVNYTRNTFMTSSSRWLITLERGPDSCVDRNVPS